DPPAGHAGPRRGPGPAPHRRHHRRPPPPRPPRRHPGRSPAVLVLRHRRAAGRHRHLRRDPLGTVGPVALVEAPVDHRRPPVPRRVAVAGHPPCPRVKTAPRLCPAHHRPLRLARIPPGHWTVEDGQVVDNDSHPFPADRVVYIPGPHEGILTYAAATVRQAADLQHVGGDVARHR